MKTIQFIEAADAQTKLDVMVEIGSVQIRPSASQEIIVEATYRHMNVWLERRGDTVIVRAEQEDDILQKLGRLFSNDHPKAEIVIQLPAECEVQAKTITGKLDIAGIQAPVSSRVITGKLALKEIHGPIYAKTITGKLAYTGELSEENHRFETVTGEIVLTLPETTNAKLSAQTATGSLSCRLPLTNLQENRHFVGGKLQGMLGNGAGRIKAKISTGSLLIRPLSPKQKDLAKLLLEASPA
jgi:hypothetical protein